MASKHVDKHKNEPTPEAKRLCKSSYKLKLIAEGGTNTKKILKENIYGFSEITSTRGPIYTEETYQGPML